MKLKVLLFLVCLTIIFSCIKRRTYVMNGAGKINRYNKHFDKPKNSLCQFNDKSYYFLYPVKSRDTIELNEAYSKFIPIITTSHIRRTFNPHKIIFLTDSTGIIETDQSGFRDFSYGLTFNLNKGEIHFRTCTGF